MNGHGVGLVDQYGVQCLCESDFPFSSGGWVAFNSHLRAVTEAALDVIYRDRNLVAQAFASAMEGLGYHVAWGVDPAEPDWPVLYISTMHGQVSWHVPKAQRIYEPMHSPCSFGPAVWDGHTNEQKAERLRGVCGDVLV